MIIPMRELFVLEKIESCTGNIVTNGLLFTTKSKVQDVMSENPNSSMMLAVKILYGNASYGYSVLIGQNIY